MPLFIMLSKQSVAVMISNKFQVKINQFPGLFSIGRKDSLWLGYMQMREKFGEEHFDFHAKTFVLPGDKGLLEKEGPIFCLNWDRNEKHDPIFNQFLLHALMCSIN